MRSTKLQSDGTSRERKKRRGPSVVILAAGLSSRFGGTKQVAELDGKKLVERVVDSIPEAKVREIVVVVGHDAAAVRRALGRREKVKVTFNAGYSRGMSTSINAGMRALAKDADGVMLMLGDQPFVTRSLVERLLKRYRSGKKIVAVSQGGVVAPPVIFPRAFFQELRDLEGDHGAKTIIQRHADSLSVVNTTSRAVTDIDTREDLRAARRLLV
ncbi:MAG: nucleotidyltransferase family protein [Thaumarchaeota archaeon]|nr:nucleotidyltransferase family protein [Nitrososphaerota archaeon]